MDRKRLKELQAIGAPNRKPGGTVEKEILGKLGEALQKKGYRPDLTVVSYRKTANKNIPVEIQYNRMYSYPEDNDLMALVAQKFPGYSVDWDSAQVDTDLGTISLVLEPSAEVIPLKNIDDIPPEFESVKTGFYKRQADSAGNMHEIWELRSDDNGLALVRRMDDMDMDETDSEQFTEKQVVATKYGIGKIVKIDKAGVAVVQIGNRRHLVAASDMTKYEQGKELGYLKEFYTQLYGPEFAKNLLEDYSNVPK